jgi:flagellar protein FlaJ
MPVKNARRLIGTKFYGVIEPLLAISPSLDMELKQADFDINARDYLSVAFFSGLFISISMFLVFSLVVQAFMPLEKAFSISILLSISFLLITILYLRIYPKMVTKKRMMDIERNLLYSIRHMHVQITSGVPVFDALVSVSQGNYGAVSQEFRIAVKEINTGLSVEKALENVTTRNPSPYFRRCIWQISNGIKSGSDLGNILHNIIEYISSEQKIMVRKYGAQLNPMTLAYMMVAVIIPSMGITLLMILSAFADVPIGESMLWGILAFLIIFQFMFLGVIKSKRPNLL